MNYDYLIFYTIDFVYQTQISILFNLFTFNLYKLMEVYLHTMFFSFFLCTLLSPPHLEHAYKTTSHFLVVVLVVITLY